MGKLKEAVLRSLFQRNAHDHDTRKRSGNVAGGTCLECDKPSSLFGQFQNDRISPTAAMLDKKLEALVTTAIR